MAFCQEEKKEILALINREVVLALGCTEPVAVALAVAKCKETLGELPERVEILLSKNVLKNAMGVGIPGTGMIGLPIAISIGLVAGKSEKGLEVLNVSEEELAISKQWLSENKENIQIQTKNTDEKLYIEIIAYAAQNTAKVIIAQKHTNFTFIEKNDEVLLSKALDENNQSESPKVELSVRKVYDFVTETPFDEIEFILETAKYNSDAANEGLKGYGLHTGKIVLDNANGDFVHTVIARTAAASDARMDGCTKPVYSNSGSGNQGITCTMPVYEYAKLKNKTNEEIARALLLSHLMSIYAKQHIGRLSALRGVVNASIGVCCGLVYLQGGSFEQISYSIKNMINSITGMICDGAKPSCALKVSIGIYAAFISSELALNEKIVDETDGLSEKDVDRSIANLGKIGFYGMNQTDDVILDIMTNKK